MASNIKSKPSVEKVADRTVQARGDRLPARALARKPELEVGVRG